MTRLPMFTVEAILAASLAVTILIGIPTLGLRPTRRDWLGIAITTAGVVAVSMSAGPEHAGSPAPWLRWAVVGALVLTLLASALWYRHGGMVIQGVLAGLGYGLSAVFIRIVLQLAADQAWWTVPEVYLTVLAGGCGVLMYARALEHGQVGPPTALLWVIMVVGPGAIGLLALGDTIVPGLELVGLVGVAAAIAGCIVLALSPTQAEASG